MNVKYIVLIYVEAGSEARQTRKERNVMKQRF